MHDILKACETIMKYPNTISIMPNIIFYHCAPGSRNDQVSAFVAFVLDVDSDSDIYDNLQNEMFPCIYAVLPNGFTVHCVFDD